MKSSEMLMLQDVWRRAYRQNGLNVKFKSKAGAVRARMQLYNAVKMQKRGKDFDDLELVRAAEELEIVWVDDLTIRLQKRAESDMMQGIMEALGAKVTDYVDPELAASSERLLKELGHLIRKEGETAPDLPPAESPVIEHKDNPFYGKRD